MISNADTPKSRQVIRAYRRVRENTTCLWSGGVDGHSSFSELIALVRNYGCGPRYFTRSVEKHQAGGLKVKASAIRDRQKLRNAPCSNENRIHDSSVRAIQDHLAQVWVVEKTEKERNSQKEVRDGAGVGRRGLGEQH